MKNNFMKNIKLLIAFLGVAVFLVSCEYQQISDATYPDQKIYLPAADVNNDRSILFAIDNVPQRVSEFLPTPGNAYRFTIDLANNKFIVPLSIYRSGINNDGLVSADIFVNNDTIIKPVTGMIAKAILPTKTSVLAADKYNLPTTVNIEDGRNLGKFNLEIDLNYLRSFNDTVFAVCLGITSSSRAVNPLKSKVVILISTKILNPTVDFSKVIDAADKAKVTFSNKSTYGVKYLWEFGDGTTDSVKNPVHFYTKSDSTTLFVKLTTFGVLGDVNKVVKVDTTLLQIKLNPISDFIYAVETGNSKKYNFTNKTKNAVSYSWTVVEKITPAPVPVEFSTDKDPSYIFPNAGTYTITLTSKSDRNTTKSKSVDIVVK